MSQEIMRYKLGSHEIIIEIDLQTARKLEKQFNFKIINFFVNPEESMKAVQDLALDEEFTIELLWFFMQNQVKITRDEMESLITSLDLLTDFREAFWGAVVNFSPVLKKQMFLDLWKEIKQEIKKVDVAEMISSALSSELEDEALTSTTSPSGTSST